MWLDGRAGRAQSGVAQRGVPGDHDALDEGDEAVQREADRTGDDDPGPRRGHAGDGRALSDKHAERVGGAAEVFRDDGSDHGQGGRQTQRGEEAG